MTMTYEFGDGLYVNLTNRCDCACLFCIRKSDSEALFEHDLWLPQEPSCEAVLADIVQQKPARYAELVFCGFGEPSYRLDDILWICDRLRETVQALPPIRLNTNGHASLLLGRDVTPELSGRLDRISISLNASNGEDYCTVTRPRAGMLAWDALLDFAQKAARFVPEVVLTIVDFEKSEEEIAACRTLADSLGVILRIRDFTEA